MLSRVLTRACVSKWRAGKWEIDSHETGRQQSFTSRNHRQGGEVSVSGITPNKDVVWTNSVGYIDQVDHLHPFLTVYETCEFAWKCRSGGRHREEWHGTGPEVDKQIAKMDEECLQ